MHRSTDALQTVTSDWWRTYPTGFAFSASAPGKVLMGLGAQGTATSSDSGRSWVHTINSVYIADVNAVAVDPRDFQVQYLGMPASGEGVYRSDDGGDKWGKKNSGLPVMAGETNILTVAVDEARPDSVFALVEAQGVFRSLDRAESWSSYSQGVIAADVKALALGRAHHGTHLLVALNPATKVPALYAREVSEANWSQIGASGPACDGASGCDVVSIAENPAQPRSAYVAVRGKGVYRVGIAGWSLLSKGVDSSQVAMVATAPERPELVAIGTLELSAERLTDTPTGNRGVYLSRNYGADFQRVATGLTDPRILSLAFAPGGQALLAGTFGGGAFRLQLP